MMMINEAKRDSSGAKTRLIVAYNASFNFKCFYND